MQGGGSFVFDWSGLLSLAASIISGTPTTITFTSNVFTNSNGVGTPPGFTETPDYDMATGLGTPNVSAIVPLLALLP